MTGIVHIQRERPMSIIRIDIDDEALAAAMKLTGASTEGAAVNTVLREYVARMRRLEAARNLAARGARGEFDEAAAAHTAAKQALKRAAR